MSWSKFLEILKMFWWVIVLIIVVIFGGFIYFSRKKENIDIVKTSSIVEKTLNKVKDAQTNVAVENAIIKTKSDAKREEIKEIKNIKDGKERRKKLAKILETI